MWTENPEFDEMMAKKFGRSKDEPQTIRLPYTDQPKIIVQQVQMPQQFQEQQPQPRFQRVMSNREYAEQKVGQMLYLGKKREKI